MDHGPVLDDGSGKPEHVRKKERRAKISAIVIAMLVLAGAILKAFEKKPLNKIRLALSGAPCGVKDREEDFPAFPRPDATVGGKNTT